MIKFALTRRYVKIYVTSAGLKLNKRNENHSEFNENDINK